MSVVILSLTVKINSSKLSITVLIFSSVNALVKEFLVCWSAGRANLAFNSVLNSVGVRRR